MKRLSTVLSMAIIALLIASCGGPKEAQVYPTDETSNTTRIKIEAEECEEQAMDAKEFLRGYGTGTAQDKMFARDIATANARNEIVNQIQVSASNLLTRFNQQHQAEGEEGLSRDEVGKITTAIKSVAEENLKGAKVTCSNTYMVGTSYEVHVCVELTGVDFTEKAYQAAVSSDQKLRIDFEEARFKEDFNKELEEFRKRK